MQKIKQDTISITTVEVYDKRTFSKVYEGKTMESDTTKAEKEVLSVYLNELADNEMPAKKSDYFARVSNAEKYRLTCKMEDFINLCFEHGTAEKIEG